MSQPTLTLEQVHAELELRPDHWRALFPLPILDRFQIHPTRLDVLATRFDMTGGMALLTRLAVQPRGDRLWRLARAALAWHVSRELDFLRRDLYFRALREALEPLDLPAWEVRNRGEEMERAWRGHVDAYLPLGQFCLEPRGEPLQQPRPAAPGLMPGAVWWVLLGAPLMRVALEGGVGPAELLKRITWLHQDLHAERQTNPALELLVPMWRLLLPPFGHDGQDPGWLEQAVQQLGLGLAGQPYEHRAKVLAVLEKLSDGLLPIGAERRGSPAALKQLRRLIDDIRVQARPREPVPMPAPGPPVPTTRVAPLPVAELLSAQEQALLEMTPTAPRTPPRPAPAPVTVNPPRPAREGLVVPPRREPPAVYESRSCRTVPLDQARAEARRMTVDQVNELLAAPPALLFDDWREECPAVAIVRDPGAVPAALWIVGDVHGDVLSLASIWHYVEARAEKEGEKPHVVFLGDFVDRGAHDHDTLLYLFGLIRDNPGQIGVLAGNHDTEFGWDNDAKLFRSRIEPAEYPRRLNALLESTDPGDVDQVRLGHLFEAFIRTRPRAIVLPDGLLLTHGGFPHTDLHGQIQSVADLGKGRCPQDFTWLRINDSSERKRPNPGNKGAQFGWADLARFAETCERIGVPLRRMVRGHDHIPERYQIHEAYKEYPVLTINAMSWRAEDEQRLTSGPAFPVVARHVPDRLPIVVRLPLDPAEVERAAPRPACEAAGEEKENTHGQGL